MCVCTVQQDKYICIASKYFSGVGNLVYNLQIIKFFFILNARHAEYFLFLAQVKKKN